MFAQLLITILMTWGVAEVGCRIFFGTSFVSAFKELFAREPDADPEGSDDLVDLLNTRREELRLARIRLRLAAKATGVSENLEIVESELRELELKLAHIERQRTGVDSNS